jgi:phosphoribosylformylglycinamidine synthase
MNFAVLQFPASNCDQDCVHVLRDVLGHSARLLWHKETSLGNADAVFVPGGFSYGDYLRTGAIARFSPAMNSVQSHADKGRLVIGICNGFQILCEAGFLPGAIARFSPVMQAVRQFAADGGLVLGICNGFQILCEAGLLPGALIRNRSLQFRCEHVFLKTLTTDSPFTRRIPAGKLLRVPIAHGEGCYFADAETLQRLKSGNQILWQYVNAAGEPTETSNPNGSLLNIAGICNERRNVAGLMPHPERASEKILGSEDGRLIFESVIDTLQGRGAARAA